MKYLLTIIAISLFIFAGDCLDCNNRMIQAKFDYASEKCAVSTAAICEAFFIEHKMVN